MPASNKATQLLAVDQWKAVTQIFNAYIRQDIFVFSYNLSPKLSGCFWSLLALVGLNIQDNRLIVSKYVKLFSMTIHKLTMKL